MIVIGVDPGLSGALAAYDSVTGSLEIIDMPTLETTVGKKKRNRLDIPAISGWLGLQRFYGCNMVMFEKVGGRTGQSASAAYEFGYSVGRLYGVIENAGIPITQVIPQTWKKAMRVPGKADDAAAGDIIGRADELFPQHKQLFRGPRGGPIMDRAEAAMLAMYGAQNA